MTEQLSGRELDKAIAGELGWTNLPQGWWKTTKGSLIDTLTPFHASVDALRAVEPKDAVLEVEVDCDGSTIAMWHPLPWRSKVYLSGSGQTEPEARARALLAWLKRNQK